MYAGCHVTHYAQSDTYNTACISWSSCRSFWSSWSIRSIVSWCSSWSWWSLTSWRASSSCWSSVSSWSLKHCLKCIPRLTYILEKDSWKIGWVEIYFCWFYLVKIDSMKNIKKYSANAILDILTSTEFWLGVISNSKVALLRVVPDTWVHQTFWYFPMKNL